MTPDATIARMLAVAGTLAIAGIALFLTIGALFLFPKRDTCKVLGHSWGAHNFCNRCHRHRDLVYLVESLETGFPVRRNDDRPESDQ